jgi:general stress protein 26
MVARTPITELEPSFSSPSASATPWATAVQILDEAEVFWLTTVRPDGRPHVTPLLAVWLDGALWFCTGETERKARNLAINARCVLTTGRNALNEGLDIVLEGMAVKVETSDRLQALAERYRSKYDWTFAVRDGRFLGPDGNVAIVFAVTPTVVFGFGKGEPFSQTRWRF